MTIRELMLEVEREIEAGRQSGAWEFDYHAEMEEVERYLCKLGAEEAPVEDEVETVEGEPEADVEIAEVEEVTAAEDCKAVAAPTPEVPEVVSGPRAEKPAAAIMEELMKGRKKEGFERTFLIYERILSRRPTTIKECAQIAREVYAKDGLKWVSRNILVSTLKDKFTKLGLIEWDGQAKSEIVWL